MKKLPVQNIIEIIEEWAPLPAAESYDNAGLLVGWRDTEVTGVLINLDVTEELLEEAKSAGINMIVTHHPIWFMPRKRLTGEDYVSRIIMKAIEYGIVLYACHTNLDNIQTGVNQKICDKLGLLDTKFLVPKVPGRTGQEWGSGMTGILPEALSPESFLQKVKTVFECGGIRYAAASPEKIQKVAVCGGSGSFLTADAMMSGADAFITADITYHKFFDNENKIWLLDIGHYESEQFTSELIYNYIIKKIPNFAVRLSETRTNPVKYF
ncbi:MAG: Nif3-like dinuclear metal center hexameric protein [Bacteroidia bacterium]|nr:Nif3-like dinuclear metal center hexameric protein [Bacteroidia bacterium]